MSEWKASTSIKRLSLEVVDGISYKWTLRRSMTSDRPT